MQNFDFNKLTVDEPVLMGIINITPDSFSDGDLSLTSIKVADKIKQSIHDGATIIDIGAESTRPQSTPIDAETEIERLGEMLPVLNKQENILYSLDTYKSETAEYGLKKGLNIINDITGLKSDPDMAKVIADYDCGVIIMDNLKIDPSHTKPYQAVIDSLEQSLEIAFKNKITPEKICLDIGIGFGKTPSQNIDIIKNLDKIVQIGFPVLVGASRKSFMHHYLNIENPVDRMASTLAVHHLAYQKGAKLFRVHDVFEHQSFFKMNSVLTAEKIREPNV